MAQEGFLVLHVCTANVCRSAMAETLMRAGLDARLPPAQRDRVGVRSAGLRGHAGAGMDTGARRALAGRQLPVEGFTATQLEPGAATGADLVLTATREHRHRVGELAPSSYPRTFTLLELAWLVGGLDLADLPTGDVAERGSALVRRCAQERGLRQHPRPDALDLADPYLGRPRAYRRSVAALDAAVGIVLDALAPLPGDERTAAGRSPGVPAQPARSPAAGSLPAGGRRD